MTKIKNITKKKAIRNLAAPPSKRHLLVAKASLNGDYVRSQQDEGNPSKTSVSLRFQDISLRHSDVQLLQGPHALNERLIGFYYAYLQSRRYKSHPDLYFLTPALAYGLRHVEVRQRRGLSRDFQLATRQFIFVPLSEGSHWSLLLVARPDRRIYYFDSQDNRHLSLARLLDERLRIPLEAENYVFTVGRCLQQAAGQGHESGVHLLCMTDTLADYVSRCGYATSTLLVSKQEVRGKRASQLQLIRTLGGIIPSASTSSSSGSKSSISTSISSSTSSEGL